MCVASNNLRHSHVATDYWPHKTQQGCLTGNGNGYARNLVVKFSTNIEIRRRMKVIGIVEPQVNWQWADHIV